MTKLQQAALRAVFIATKRGDWYRAITSGHSGGGERVTLASLYRRGALERRAWRGKEGEANAAYEYRIHPGHL